MQYVTSDCRGLAQWIVQDGRNEKKWKVGRMKRETGYGEKR